MKLLFKILLFLYCLFCIVLFFVQDDLIFQPHSIMENHRFRQGFEIEIPIDEGLSMNALMIQADPNQKSEQVILYFHGNKGNIRRCIYQTRQMQDLGYDILLVDYRGYGKTEGKIKSNQQLLDDANLAFEYLKKSYKESNISVIGYSLGTGMASYVAGLHSPKMLLLIAPFTSLTAIKNQYVWFVPDFLLKYKLDNQKHLYDVDVPVTLLHGGRDRIVKHDYSVALKKEFPDKCNLISVENESHRGIIFNHNIREVLQNSYK